MGCRCLAAWRQRAERRKQLGEMHGLVAAMSERAAAKVALQGWRAHAALRTRRNGTAAAIVHRMRSRHLAAGFSRWRAYLHGRQAEARIQADIAATEARRVLRSAWMAWAAEQARRRKMWAVVQRLRSGKQRVCLRLWRERAAGLREAQSLEGMVLSRLRAGRWDTRAQAAASIQHACSCYVYTHKSFALQATRPKLVPPHAHPYILQVPRCAAGVAARLGHACAAAQPAGVSPAVWPKPCAA